MLNTRGLDLSATDILKAEIIGAVSETDRAAYTKKWEDEEDDLGRQSFGELFSHIRMVFRKAKPRGTLLAEFREHVIKGTQPTTFIDDILLPMAAVYEELTDAVYASTDGAEKVNEYLKWLNRLEFNDWLPPALAFAVRWRNQPGAIEAFFRDLERLAYSMLVRRSGVNERIERFSHLTKVIEENDDLYDTKSPLQLTPVEQFAIYSALDGPIYDSLSARARSTILLRLDALLSGGGATYDYETVTVEHVLPQSPPGGSEWLDWFPDEEVRAEIVHTLGNLALLTRKKNSAASNYDFDRKKRAYFSLGGVSPFVLTTQVLQHSAWTPDIVSERQQVMLDRLEQHWRLYDRKSSSVEKVVARGDGSWRNDVREALSRLEGRASLSRIYKEVEAIRRSATRSVPTAFEAVVRRTLEENSSDSDSYKGGPDLFRMAEGKGAGIWELRNLATVEG